MALNKLKFIIFYAMVIDRRVHGEEEPCCNYRGTFTRIGVSNDENEWIGVKYTGGNAKIIVKQEIADSLPIQLQMYYKTIKENEFHKFTKIAFCYGLMNLPDSYYNSSVPFVILKKAILPGMGCPVKVGSYELLNTFHTPFTWGGEVPSCVTPIILIERLAHGITNETLFSANYELIVDNALDCELLDENKCNWLEFIINHLKIYDFQEWKKYALDNECWLWLRHLKEAYEMFVKTPIRMIYNLIRNTEKNHSLFSINY